MDKKYILKLAYKTVDGRVINEQYPAADSKTVGDTMQKVMQDKSIDLLLVQVNPLQQAQSAQPISQTPGVKQTTKPTRK